MMSLFRAVTAKHGLGGGGLVGLKRGAGGGGDGEGERMCVSRKSKSLGKLGRRAITGSGL